MTVPEKQLLRGSLAVLVQTRGNFLELGKTIAKSCSCDLDIVFNWVEGTAITADLNTAEISDADFNDFLQLLEEQRHGNPAWLFPLLTEGPQ